MRFSIVGNGNVAWHFLHAFNRAGHICTEIIGRGPRPAGLQLPSWSAYKQLSDGEFKETDICFLCVADDAIEEVAAKFNYKQTIVVHCSGSMPLHLISQFEKCAIAWPVYSLTKNIPIDYSTMPVCIETKDFLIFQTVEQFFSPITRLLHQVAEDQRKSLHLGAVFGNNFTNFMYAIAAELCEKQHVSFDILKPLIIQTTEKIKYQLPYTVQTGPASRHDLSAIARHLEMLENAPDFKTLYMLLTELIVERFSSDKESN